MTPPEDVTLGEVHRLLKRVDNKVDKINGQVTSHDRAIIVLETKINATQSRSSRWGAVFGGVISTIFGGLYYIFFDK